MLIINGCVFYLKCKLWINKEIFRILIFLYINIMCKTYKVLILCVLHVLVIVNMWCV